MKNFSLTAKLNLTLISALLVLGSFISFRNYDMTWSDKLRKNGFSSIIGEENGILYGIMYSGTSMSLQRVSAETMEFISSEPIDKPSSGYVSGFGYIHDEKIILFGGDAKQRKSEFVLYAAVLDLEGNMIKDWKPILSSKNDYSFESEIFALKPDKSGFALGLTYSEKNKHDFQITVFDNDFNMTKQKLIHLENEEKYMCISSIRIDNNNTVSAIANYRPAMKYYAKQAMNPLQNSGLFVFLRYSGDELTSQNIEVEGHQIFSGKVELDPNDQSIVLAGIYGNVENKVEGMEGYFISRIATNESWNALQLSRTEEYFTSDLVQAKAYDKHRKNYSAFFIRDILPESNGEVNLIGECLYYRFFSESGSSPNQKGINAYSTESNSAMVVKFNRENRAVYNRIIPCKSKDAFRNSNYSSTYISALGGDGVNVYFYDNPKNLPFRENNTHFESLNELNRNDKELVCAHINPTGKISYRPLETTDSNIEIVFQYYHFRIGNSFYLTGTSGNAFDLSLHLGKLVIDSD